MKPHESLGKWISLIHRQGQITLGHELEPYLMGGGQVPFLMQIFEQDGLNQGELSKIVGVDKATSGRALKKLADAGYVERKRDPNDRRAYRIFLTHKGKEMEPTLRRILSDWTETLSNGFSQEERWSVLEFLKRMHENVVRTKYADDPEGGVGGVYDRE